MYKLQILSSRCVSGLLVTCPLPDVRISAAATSPRQAMQRVALQVGPGGGVAGARAGQNTIYRDGVQVTELPRGS